MDTPALPPDALVDAMAIAGVACWLHAPGGSDFVISGHFSRLIGIAHDRLPRDSKAWLEITHPEDQAAFARLLALFAGELPPEDLAFSLRLRHAHGFWVWLQVRVVATSERRLATFTDITEQKQTEAALYDSQLRYRALYATAPLAFILWNREGYIGEWNQRAEEMFGWPAASVIGKKVHTLLLPADQHDAFRQAVQGLTQGQANAHFSGPAYDRRGLLLQCNWYNVALRSAQGTLIGILSLVLDVTQEVLAQQRIQRNEKIYRSLVETSPDAILLLDLHGKVTTANQQAQTLFGLGAPATAVTYIRDLLVDPLPEQHDFLHHPEHCSGFIMALDLRMRHLQGKVFDASLSLTTIVDTRGTPTSIVLFARDVTETLRSQRELEAHRLHLEQRVHDRTLELDAARQALAQIVDNSPIPTFVLNSEHEVTHWNRACTGVTGLPASEMIGTTQQWAAFYPVKRPVMADLVMHNSVAEIERYYGHKYRPSQSVVGGYEAEDYFPAFDRWLYITAAPLHDANGQVIGAIETLQDISERKLAEQTLIDAKSLAESAANAKTEFLANMSHEIRTPMNAVIGLANLLHKTNLTRKQHEYVSRIRGAGAILMRLVNDVLDFSKIEAGRMQLEATEFALDTVLNNVATVVMSGAQEKGLELQYVVAPNVPSRFIGDPLRLTQILVNLIGNAIKFTAHGGVTTYLRISQDDSASQGVRLQVEVKDTGIGMTQTQMERLFQAFAQADTSTTRNYGGTGLGLAICKRLVELMDGEIWVNSQPGVGSTFGFDIGLGVPADNELLASRPSSGPSRRVLVVDDNPLARMVLCRLLGKLGFESVTATSGSQALTLIEQSVKPFDYVLMDLNMPGMNGLELAAVIRDQLRRPPKLVLVTASDLAQIDEQGKLTLFDGALNKPITLAHLQDLFADREDAGLTVADATALHGLRVLVTEDIPTNQLIATELLQSFGVEVSTADNGRLALDYMAAHGDRIDLILMDMQMPEMDGLEATRQLRRRYANRYLPIIAMTAHALDEERQRCFESGMDDFITKPVDPDILFQALLRWKPGKPQTPPPPPMPDTPTAVPPPADDGLPELPGIDKADGLKRMMNKVPLYQRVLRDFHARFHHEAVNIRAALAKEDWPSAERMAHSAKGLAGSIGALGLQQAALTLEHAIKASQALPPAEMAAFERELTLVIDGIRDGFGLGGQ